MASNNMFAVLRQDESDDEEKPKKQTKHEQRADDKSKREAHGDRSGKVDTKKTSTGAVQKDSYNGGEKRQYDRRSGDGNNDRNYEKKGGAGKGNWGSDQPEGNAEGKDANAPANDQPEEKVEPVLSLDDYLKDNAMEYQATEDSGDNKNVVAEKGFKVMKTKEADFVEANTKTTNLDGLTKIKTNQIVGTEAQGYGRRPVNILFYDDDI